MKSLLLVYENAAAAPAEELGGRTPLQVARCPAATRLASEGLCGSFGRPPAGERLRPEPLLAGLMGVPRSDAWRLARGPLEAESVVAGGASFTYAYRADLVTMENGIVRDACLARLTWPETGQLVDAAQHELLALPAELLPVAPGRAVALLHREDQRPDPLAAPWLVEDEEESPALEGRSNRALRAALPRVAHALAEHAINEVRVDLGENPANAIWLWGGGHRVELLEKFGGRPLHGVMLSRSPMARGLARLMGMAVEDLPDPAAVEETQPVLAAERMAALFRAYDLVVVYVEAPVGLLRGSPGERVRLLERMDLVLTGPLLEAVRKVKHRRFVLASAPAAATRPNRPRGPAWPLVVWGAHVDADPVPRWDEAACAEGELRGVEPLDVFGRLLGG